MKLPTLKGRKSFYPQKALCPWCENNKVLEPHSFAILGGGALLMDRKDNSGGPDDKMNGFLHLSWHGAHDGGLGKDKGIGASIEIARDVRGGQFDLYFCSTHNIVIAGKLCDQVQILEQRLEGKNLHG